MIFWCKDFTKTIWFHKLKIIFLPRFSKDCSKEYIITDQRKNYFVGYKAKGRILKQVLQGNKARQIFRKKNISYLLIRTRACAYQGVKNVGFSEKLACFVFL